MRLSLKISSVATVIVAIALFVDGYVRVSRERVQLAERNLRAHARALAAAVAMTAERQGAERALELLEDVWAGVDGIAVRWVPATGREHTARRAEHSTASALTSRTPLWLDGPGELVLRKPFAWDRRRASLVAIDAARATVVPALATMLTTFAASLWLVALPLQALLQQSQRLGGESGLRAKGIRPAGELGELATNLYGLALRLASTREQLNRLLEDRRASIARVLDADRWTTLGRLSAAYVPQFVSRLTALEARAAALARGPGGNERTRGDAQRVCENAIELSVDLHPLLAFSEVSGARRPALDLRLMVATVADLLAGIAQVRRVDLCVSSDEQAVVAHVHPAQIQQLLVALVLNAIHAQPDGGTVQIAAHADCRPYLQGLKVGARSYVCLVVDDHGVGMTPEVQQRMFEPFFTTRQLGEGTGLGLAAVTVIVEEHHGFIGVETAPRAGTRMTVFLPSSLPV